MERPQPGDMLWAAATRSTGPSTRNTIARSASHSRPAFSASVWNTGCRSNVERLITLSNSLVAVCCSRAILTGISAYQNRRTFSMAITAWSAKVWRSATCLSEKGCGVPQADIDACP